MTPKILLLLALLATASAAAARPFEENRVLAAKSSFETEKPKYRRDREVDIERVSVEFEPDFAALTFKGTVTHRFRVLAPELTELVLDAKDLDVTKAADGRGRALEFEVIAQKLRVKLRKALAAGARESVRVEYSGGAGAEGLSMFKPDARYPGQTELLYTQGEPETNSHWVPLYDYPNQRSATEITAVVPDGFVALSNGRLASKEPGPRPGTTRWHWVQERAHASYLMALYVARYGKVEASAEVGAGESKRTVPMAYYAPAGREEDARLTFAKTPAMVAFFSQWLDYPYAWERYDQVVNYRYGGGMENTSATNIGERNLRDRRALLGDDSDGLISHELAHQWFGDLITCKDWSHIWINEASASFFQALWTQKDRGEDEYLWDIWGKGKRYFGEAGSYLRPIVTERYADAGDVFDSHTYQKGSYVLHMLRRDLGEQRFQAGWRRFVRDNHDTVADTEDLRRAFEGATGRTLAEFFGQWVYGSGHPDLKLTLAYDDKTDKLSLTATQRQVKKGRPAFKFKLPLMLPGGRIVVAELADAEQTASWDVSSRPKWVALDPGLAALAEVELEWPEDMLLAELAAGPTGVDRARAAETLAKKGSPKIVAALSGCVKKDPFWGTAATCAESLATIGGTPALEGLSAAADHKDPKVRRAVASALSSFTRRPEALAALKPLADDESWLVQGEALRAMGSVRLSEARPILEAKLDTESWNDVARAASLDALGRLRDPALVPLLTKWAGTGHSIYARMGAMQGLARAGEALPGTYESLSLILDTETDPQVLGAAVGALRTLGEPKAIPALSRLAARAGAGNSKQARDAAEAIREGRKGRLEELSGQVDEFSKRLETLEKRLEDSTKKKKG